MEKIESATKTTIPQINDEMRQAIEIFLNQIEEIYKIKIFFACDTGSRAIGVAAETSDFDINGFFIRLNQEIPNEKLICKNIMTKFHFESIIKQQEKFSELFDIQIWDFEYWKMQKIKTKLNSCDYWFNSPIIYRDEYPEMISKIKMQVSPPLTHFWGAFNNNYHTYNKKLTNGVENKKIMNNIIYLVQYLHSVFFQDFPIYNIFDEISYMIANKNVLLNYLTEEEYSYLINCFDYIKETYEEKKKNKKSLTYQMPLFLKNFINLILQKKKNWLEDKIDVDDKSFENMLDIFNSLIIK